MADDDGVRFYRDSASTIDPGQPDVLVEMGREVRDAILRHPERYASYVLGTQVFVVDDPAYESLFYLFSGQTRKSLYADKEQVGAIVLKNTPVLSDHLYSEARKRELGLS